MTLTLFKFVSAIIILFIAVIAGIWPFIKKSHSLETADIAEFDFPLGESLASGIFLGAGLLHMLPDAVSAFSKAGYTYPFPFLIAATSFLLLLLLEHIGTALRRHSHKIIASLALLTVLMLSIHSLLAGTAVGLATSFTTTFIIFLAIIAHKGAASFALSINLNRSQLRLSSRIIAFSIFVLMTPMGIFMGNWFIFTAQDHALLTPIFSSLAAGTFLYIGTLHGLDRACLIRHCCNAKEFFCLLFGFTVMAIVAIWT